MAVTLLRDIEVWTTFEAAGGIPVAAGRFLTPWVVRAEEETSLTGEEVLDLAVAKGSPGASALLRGRVVRIEFETGDPAEWEVDRTTVESGGDDLLLVARCVGARRRLQAVPVIQEDGDGFVRRDVPLVQLPPAEIVPVVLTRAPVWFEAGTITPTDPEEIQFEGDSALSALQRLAELTGYDLQVRRDAGDGFLVDLVDAGATAEPWRLETARNLRSLRREIGATDQITRVAGVGADGDDGASSLAWAYWLVTPTTGTLVSLASLHGGPAPIGYDDQFNHAHLGGTAYLENARTGARVAIVDTLVATQELELSSVAGWVAGDWGRIVMGASGTHLVTLDAPAEVVANGGRVRPGEVSSPWDDTVNILKNPTARDYPNPSAWPTGWTGFLTGAETEAAGEQLTAGRAVAFSGSVAAGGVITRWEREWFVTSRRSTWSATLWVRPITLGGGAKLGVRITRNGVPVGGVLVYESPVNVWRQLSVEGVHLPEGSGTLGVELFNAGTGGYVAGFLDSVQLSPSLGARAILEGSGAARIWRQAQQFLDRQRAEPVTWTVVLADLARAGVPWQPQLVLGAWGTVVDEVMGETVEARIVRIRRNLLAPLDTAVTLATEHRRLRDRFAQPRPLVVPFFEPIHLQTLRRDERNAALRIKAEIIASDAISVTVQLQLEDSHGGTPSVAVEAFGAVLVSGEGAGPYIFLKPAQGSGGGRVVFTASLQGRENVHDAVDVAESSFVQEPGTEFTECRITVVSTTGSTYTVQVTGASIHGLPSVELVSITGSGTLDSGAAIGVPAESGSEWVFTRAVSGDTEVRFRATLPGSTSDDDYLTIPEEDVDTLAVIVRPRILSVSAEEMVVRITLVDPEPQGAGSGEIAYTGLAGISPSSPQTVTPVGQYVEEAGSYVDFTLPRPVFEDGNAEVKFTGSAASRVSDSDGVTVPARAAVLVDVIMCECRAEITAIDATTVTVTVTGSRTPGTTTGLPLPGNVEVELVAIDGTATLNSGAAVATPVASGSVWVFDRAADTDPASYAQFRASLVGAHPDDDLVVIPEQDNATLRMRSRARILNITPSAITVRVLTADPTPQGADSATITVDNPDGLTVSPEGPETTTPEDDLDEAEGTYQDFVILRPNASDAAVTFETSADDRLSDFDPVGIPAQTNATLYATCRAVIIRRDEETVVVQVTATGVGGVPTVQLVAVGPPATLESGAPVGDPQASGARWTFRRGATHGEASFRAVLAGLTSGEATCVIPALGDDDDALELAVRVLSSTDTEVAVRVSVADPDPQGADSAEITYAAVQAGPISPASGQTVTPEATIDEADDSYIDFSIGRPPAGSGGGSVRFEATAADRIPARGSVIIPEQPPVADLTVLDGSTTVIGVRELEFAGATVSNEGAGRAKVVVSGGGGGADSVFTCVTEISGGAAGEMPTTPVAIVPAQGLEGGVPLGAIVPLSVTVVANGPDGPSYGATMWAGTASGGRSTEIADADQVADLWGAGSDNLTRAHTLGPAKDTVPEFEGPGPFDPPDAAVDEPLLLYMSGSDFTSGPLWVLTTYVRAPYRGSSF